MPLTEDKRKEVLNIAALVTNVILAVVDYAKANTQDEKESAERNLRDSIGDGALMIGESNGH